MSSGATSLAGRYAAALYALAIDNNKVDCIHDELSSIADLLGESQDLKNQLNFHYMFLIKISAWILDFCHRHNLFHRMMLIFLWLEIH